ncbi:hypothetical protein BDY19DRAFT_892739 [Irpex rosettiformis]|uniref:Uncharacterized protein n=1 Tax=Irpex rosettiformis TaxID=378272 RepID=A0ACB8TZL5_9APHY|nr:hypothetical protein BDY19DRAFT_892739 [Irpex rosettiformis]
MSYHCDLCDRYFANYNGLRQHKETSARHSSYWYCGDCNREFSSNWALNQHYSNSPEHCSFCNFCCQYLADEYDLEEHNDSYHVYCDECDQLCANDASLRQHYTRSHWYCGSCNRLFRSEHDLDIHLRTSSIHNPRSHFCPGRGCGKAFVAYGDLTSHLESGTCPGGFNRRNVNRMAIRADTTNVFTNSSRLIGYNETSNVVNTWATDDSWNGYQYECVLCHKEFRTLSALNAHLNSPAHADKVFRCPTNYHGCGQEFRTLSGLLSHIERSECGVTRFRRQLTDTLDNVTSGMRRLTMY